MSPCGSTTTENRVAGRGETILLVEDEAFVREVTCCVLQSAGYEVLSTADADEALWTFSRHEGPVHLLLTDMVMPGKNGPALAAELGALSPEMKTILTSGYGDSVILDDVCRNSRVFYLPKPFTVQSLTLKVRNVLDNTEDSGLNTAITAGAGTP